MGCGENERYQNGTCWGFRQCTNVEISSRVLLQHHAKRTFNLLSNAADMLKHEDGVPKKKKLNIIVGLLSILVWNAVILSLTYPKGEELDTLSGKRVAGVGFEYLVLARTCVCVCTSVFFLCPVTVFREKLKGLGSGRVRLVSTSSLVY